MIVHDFQDKQLVTQMLPRLLAPLPVALHADISERFMRHAPLLLNRLSQVYGDTPNFSNWLLNLMSAMGTLLAERPADLIELDRQRLTNPHWFMQSNMLGYCTYVDKFGGDLQGVQKRIHHLQELGVSYLHLLPFLKSREGENDGGFAVQNFGDVEPQFGTIDDLKNLSAALRGAGISLCSDFILNHVADSHAWAQAAMAGDKTAQDYFYTFDNRATPDLYEAHLKQVFPHVAPGNFSYNDTMQKWVWTTFYPYQWDLNYANPVVFSEMVQAMLHLANCGVEVFRLDSTAYLWKRLQTTCMNQPEVHWLLQAMRAIVDIVAPAVLLKAEAIVETAELPGYLGGVKPNLPECHLAYHSTLMASAWVAMAHQNVDILRKVIAATPTIHSAVSWLTYVRCHDDIGWNVLLPEANLDDNNGTQILKSATQFLTGNGDSYARGVNFQASQSGVHGTNGMTAALVGLSSAQTPDQFEAALKRYQLLFGLAFCFGGMPLIYMGDELGQDNDTSYQNNPLLQEDSRWLQRPAFDETALSNRHNLATQTGKIHQALTQLTKQRSALPQLASDAPRTLLETHHAAVLGFIRGDMQSQAEGTLLYLSNFSALAVNLDLSKILQNYAVFDGVTKWHNYLDSAQFNPTLTLAPYSQIWLAPLFKD